MGYIKEDEILLYEELCAKPVDVEDRYVKATIRFRENIRLANSIASKYSIPYDASLDRDDVIQEAYLSLWRACLNFEEDRGFAFSTYAVPLINGNILRMLRDSECLKTPRVFKDIRSSLLKHGFSLPLSDEEVSVLVSEGKFSRAQIIEYADISFLHLDAPISEDSDESFGAVVSTIIPEIQLSEDEIESAIDKVLLYMKPKYRDMIEEWIYATMEGEKISQTTLGQKYNISQTQVNRVLKSVIQVVDLNKEEIKSLFGLD